MWWIFIALLWVIALSALHDRWESQRWLRADLRAWNSPKSIDGAIGFDWYEPMQVLKQKRACIPLVNMDAS
jgi:hypothetical protein